MKRRLTLKHIAKELDVAVSTVSKALRDSPEISKDTKDKIKAFAKLYNFKPNNIALSLKNRKTKTIGVIIPEIIHHFFTTVISGIEQEANKRGYNVLICMSNNSLEKEMINMELLANGSTDGFIISVAKETQQKKDYQHLTNIINQGVPLVMFDRVIEEIKCDKVIIDDLVGAKRAVNHLIELNCRKIALITTVDYLSVGKLRTRGYKEALAERNIAVDEGLILKVDDFEKSEAEIRKFLTGKNIDAVFAVNEHFAIYAIKSLKEQGLNVPDEVLVVGFTNGELSKQFIPSLTTVSQHGAVMGAKAASLLIQRLENENGEDQNFETIVVETELIERESTDRKR